MAKSSQFETDTKGICLICLSTTNWNSLKGSEGDGDEVSTTPTAFKMLLRYLQVRGEVDSSTPLRVTSYIGFNNIKLTMSLCEDCSSVTNDFLELYQAFEGIRLQLDLCVRQLHEFMEIGGEDSDRAQEFKKWINTFQGYPENTATILETMRKEMVDKVSRKVRGSFPRISLGASAANLETTNTTQPPVLSQDDNLEDTSARPQEPEMDHHNICVLYGNDSCLFTNSDYSDEDEGESGDMDLCSEITAEQAEKACASLENPLPPITEEMGRDDEPTTKETIISISNDVDDNFQIQSDTITTTEQVEESTSSDNAIQSSEVAAAPSSLECVYCDKLCSRKNYLRSHQYHKHALQLLLDEGLLPPGISEEQLDDSVKAIIGHEGNTVIFKCPLCEREGFHFKYHLRTHLLQQHLPNVVSNIGDVNRTCIPCTKTFGKKEHLHRHQLTMHTMTYLSNKGVLPLGVSDQQIDFTLKAIMGQSCYRTCPLCSGRFRTRKITNLRQHLLQVHLPQIINSAKNDVLGKENWDDKPVAIPSASGLHPSSKLDGRGGNKKKLFSSHRRKQDSFQVRVRVVKKRMSRKADPDNWKCGQCLKGFSNKGNLFRHRFLVHPRAVLKSRLGSAVSEEHVIALMARISSKAKKVRVESSTTCKYECLWCGKVIWGSLNVHLLQKHLDQIIQRVRAG